jgi:hypothetical protein
VAQLVYLYLRGYARGEQAVLPVILALLIGKRVLRGCDLGLALPIGRLQSFDLKPRAAQARLGLLHRDSKWRVVDAKQHGALFDELIVAHVDRAHTAGDVGADDHLRRLNVGVIG